MSPHRVINLRDLLDDQGEPAEPAKELATWLGALVECVTTTGSHGHWTPVPVACRECVPAQHHVTAVRCVGPGIEWFCAACRASGTLMGWRGSQFDLSEHPALAGDEANTVPLLVRLDELTWLRPHARAVTLRIVLASAIVEREHVALLVTKQELAALLACAELAAGAASGKERNALERLIGRCDSALGLMEHEAGSRTLH